MNHTSPQPLIARVCPLLAWVAPLVFVVLGLLRLRYPGLHFDELLPVNAALGGLDDTFMYRSLDVPLIGRVPVILMPYIGALKAYLISPVFWLFGVSVETIRIPMLVVGAVGLRLLYSALTRSAGPLAACAVVVMLAVDPTLISLVRADSGPVALQFLLTVVVLWSFEHYRSSGQYRFLALLLASLGLGVFNKLNFIWIVAALVGAAVLAYGRPLYRSLRSQGKLFSQKFLHGVTAIAGLSGVIGYYLLVSYKFNLGGFLDPSRLDLGLRLQNVWVSVRGMLTGELFYDYALGELQARGATVVLVLVGVVVVLGAIFFIVSPAARRTVGRFYLFTWFLALLTLVEIFVTRNAVWPWHYATLYPALTILLVLSIKVLVPRLGRVVWLLVPLLVVYYLATYGAYVSQYGQMREGGGTKNVYWSPAIYELIENTASGEYRYVSLDWGTHTQLLGLSRNPDKFKNASFFMNRSPLPTDAREQFASEYLRAPASADAGDQRPWRFILHTPEATLFPSARENFFALTANLTDGRRPVLIQTIDNGTEPLFEVYELR